MMSNADTARDGLSKALAGSVHVQVVATTRMHLEYRALMSSRGVQRPSGALSSVRSVQARRQKAYLDVGHDISLESLAPASPVAVPRKRVRTPSSVVAAHCRGAGARRTAFVTLAMTAVLGCGNSSSSSAANPAPNPGAPAAVHRPPPPRHRGSRRRRRSQRRSMRTRREVRVHHGGSYTDKAAGRWCARTRGVRPPAAAVRPQAMCLDAPRARAYRGGVR